MADLQRAAAQLAILAARIANYCDHAEHLEATDRDIIIDAGAALRALATEVAAENNIDIVKAYADRLEAVERRHPLYPANGYAAIKHIPAHAATWRLLQTVQWDHDRQYHPDVFGLSRYEQLRHCAFHIAKIAGAAAEGINSGQSHFLQRRLPDVLVFGLKVATLLNEPLPDTSVT